MATPFDTLANSLFTSLIAGTDFTIPDFDVSGAGYDLPGGDSSSALDPIVPLTDATLTNATALPNGDITGTGTLDHVMNTLVLHLNREYKQGRIQGAEYTKAYVGMLQVATQTAVNYLLGKDTAYWQAQTAQMGLVNSRVQLAIAKTTLEMTRIQGYEAQAQYALTKGKLSTESAMYDNQTKDFEIRDYNLTTQLPAQTVLVKEQGEAQRAQTLDTRSDGATVTGVMGKQKDLYSEQITSYKRDAEVKASRAWIDAWITMKTIDEGLLPPDQFTNTEINEVLVALKTNNNLGTV